MFSFIPLPFTNLDTQGVQDELHQGCCLMQQMAAALEGAKGLRGTHSEIILFGGMESRACSDPQESQDNETRDANSLQDCELNTL